MSFAEFNQAKGELSGLVGFEAEPDRTVTPPDEAGGLVHASVSTEDDTGSYLVFNLETRTWGTVVRGGDTPYNDCLPPGDTVLMEAFRRESTPEEILGFLKESSEESFVNAFEVVLSNRDGNELQHFVGSVQSRHQTLPLGHYRLSDSDSLEPVDDPPGEGLANLIAQHASPDEISRHLTDIDLTDRLADDGMRELAHLMVFRWNADGLEYRCGSDREALLSSGLTSIQSG